jgi:hypothetical protein
LFKTGFTRPQSVVHFAVGVAHFHWDELAAGEGNWTAATNQWSVDEDNRDISSQRLLDTILKEMRLRTKRDNLTKWLHPGGLQFLLHVDWLVSLIISENSISASILD